ncbi:hypothetical protein PMIN03_011314 [Paraphaeosphaeria minitans]
MRRALQFQGVRRPPAVHPQRPLRILRPHQTAGSLSALRQVSVSALLQQQLSSLSQASFSIVDGVHRRILTELTACNR